MAESNVNLWAPWRAAYLRSLGQAEQAGDCFLCEYGAAPQQDRAHHVICRSSACLMVMNRFPYTNGHVMVAPLAHAAGLEELDDAVLLDMTQHIRLAMSLLARVLQPDGYNVGMNFGRCAGAGLPGHTHAHVVPRWAGDTNFMTCTGGVRLIPEDLDELYGRLCTALEDSRERRAASSD